MCRSFFDYPLFTGQCEQLARSTWNILLDWLEKNLTTEIKYFSSLRFVIMSENVSLVWRRKNHPQCRKEWAIYYREDKNKRELNFIISLFSCLLFPSLSIKSELKTFCLPFTSIHQEEFFCLLVEILLNLNCIKFSKYWTWKKYFVLWLIFIKWNYWILLRVISQST